MKKFLVSLLAAAFALALCACGGGGSGSNVQAPSSTSSVEQAEPPAEEATIEETVLVDQDGLRVTATSLNEDGWSGPEVNLLIENNSGRTLTVQAWYASVNGCMCETISSVDVADGKKANETVTFDANSLELAGIERVSDIEFTVHASDYDSFETYLDVPVSLETSLSGSLEQTYDDSGDVIYDANGIQIIAKGLSDEASWLGPGVIVEIINNSDQDITVQARDVSINGFMIDPWFSCDVCAGKRAITDIGFASSDLENNGIEAIESVELSFHIFQLDGWDTIADSDPIMLEF